MRSLVWHEDAQQDLADAVRWYRENTSLGADVFVQLVTETIESVQQFPFAAPRWSHDPGIRRQRVRERLPYCVIYRVTDDMIRIVALAHTSRDPAYWLARVK